MHTIKEQQTSIKLNNQIHVLGNVNNKFFNYNLKG